MTHHIIGLLNYNVHSSETDFQYTRFDYSTVTHITQRDDNIYTNVNSSSYLLL